MKKQKKNPREIKGWAITYEGDDEPEIFYTYGEAIKGVKEYNYKVEIHPCLIKIID